jgi:hypothetical protein
MSDNPGASRDRDALLDDFVAQLTRVVYCVALRHGTAGVWVDLELDLWRAMAEMVQGWGQECPPDSEEAFACGRAACCSEAVTGDVRDGRVHWRHPQEPLSGE